ncbi:MAG TPA: DoxX family protein [Terracidiphilus sp.]|nr:DoxX family protein [Terracidiphilus sp.]
MPAITSNGPSSPFADDAAAKAIASSTPSSVVHPARGASRARLWTGRALTTLATLFLLFDIFGKFARPPQVMQAFARLGFSASFSVEIGAILLACTVLYAIPRTTAFGALILTGYLGGAVAIQWRAASPPFETSFPILFAVLVWAGVFLREDRLWSLCPIRRSR